MSNRYQGGFITASYNGLKVPNAPTIGTATASGPTASVTFTAPSNIGGSAITGYTVISSPGSITGTGTSSPITVTGLTGNTTYTFTVVATNSYGTGPASAVSNSVTTPNWPAAIGAAYGGGYFAGQVNQSGTVYNLIVSPKSTGESSLAYKTANTDDPSAVSVIDGPANSAAINNAAHPAAQFCEGLTIGGFSDWYMPAQNELETCYYYLKPNSASNGVGEGSNANAVSPEPISTGYTSGSPAQTSVVDFQVGGSQAFAGSSTADRYYASTQTEPTSALYQNFYNGAQNGSSGKTTVRYVRAIRRVAA
jgi:hypothetical protein